MKTLYAVLKVQKPNKKESVTRLRVILERVFLFLKYGRLLYTTARLELSEKINHSQNH